MPVDAEVDAAAEPAPQGQDAPPTDQEQEVPALVLEGPGAARYLKALADLSRIIQDRPFHTLEIHSPGVSARMDIGPNDVQDVFSAVIFDEDGHHFAVGAFPRDGGFSQQMRAGSIKEARGNLDRILTSVGQQ